MKHALHIISVCGLLLAGCATQDTETTRSLSDILRTETGQDMTTPKCMAPEGLIGQSNTEIQKLKLKSPVRVIYPGTIVPDDHVSNRLNFKVDKKGVIKSITCG